MAIMIKRTTANDEDFQALVRKLDHELWNELKEDQATYDQFNKVPDISTAVIAYWDAEPVACGCFKEFDHQTAEIKRMFVRKDRRGMGLSKQILAELEQWASEKSFRYTILETSVHFTAAKGLYLGRGYKVITNYGPYTDLPESLCLKKELQDSNHEAGGSTAKNNLR